MFENLNTSDVIIGGKTYVVFKSPPSFLSLEEDATKEFHLAESSSGIELWMNLSWMGRRAYFLVVDGVLEKEWLGISDGRNEAMRIRALMEKELLEKDARKGEGDGERRRI